MPRPAHAHAKSDKQFVAAMAHHQAGRLGEAARLYRDALKHDPKNPDILRLLGSLYIQTNNPADAEATLRKAAELQPGNPEIFNNLGVALRNQNKFGEACDAFREALRLRPDYADALNNIGNALHVQNQLGEAIAYYWQALRVKPDYLTALHNMGNAMRAMGRYDDAVEHYKKGLELQPGEPTLLVDLGLALHLQDKLDQACAVYRETLRLKPDYYPALVNLGSALRDQRKSKEAAECFERALRVKPESVEVLVNLGAVYWDMAKLDEAVAYYRRALQINPDYVEGLVNLGTALWGQGKPEEAAESYKKALRLRPGQLDAITNLGALSQDLVDYDKAMGFYEAALELDPKFAPARWRKSLILLAAGNYREGWELYEAGLGKRGLRGPMLIRSQPPWDGTPIPGQRLVVWGEQGLGDSLQFVRYAALCKPRAGSVRVLCPKPLVRLFAASPYVDIVADTITPGDFDAHASMMSLPHLFGTTLETVPAEMPYLFVPKEVAQTWAPKLAGLKGLKVGLVWAGSAREEMINCNLTDRKRSLSLEKFRPLFDVPGVSFVNLQMGKPAAQIAGSDLGARLFNVMGEVGDFLDTAAIIQTLDLVITVDTSVAHLAGYFDFIADSPGDSGRKCFHALIAVNVGILDAVRR